MKSHTVSGITAQLVLMDLRAREKQTKLPYQ